MVTEDDDVCGIDVSHIKLTNGGFVATHEARTLKGRLILAQMAACFSDLLDAQNADNFVEMTFGYPGNLSVVTVRRENGKSPGQLLQEIKDERDRLLAEVAELKTRLKAEG